MKWDHPILVPLVSAMAGAILTLVIGMLVFELVDYRAFSIINIDALVERESLAAKYVSDLTVAEVEALRKLEARGVLLSPQEYVSHIVSYFNSLLTLFSVFIGIMAIVCVFIVRRTARYDIEDYITEHPEVIINKMQGDAEDSFISRGTFDDYMEEFTSEINCKIETALERRDSSNRNIEDLEVM